MQTLSDTQTHITDTAGPHIPQSTQTHIHIPPPRDIHVRLHECEGPQSPQHQLLRVEEPRARVEREPTGLHSPCTPLESWGVLSHPLIHTLSLFWTMTSGHGVPKIPAQSCSLTGAPRNKPGPDLKRNPAPLSLWHCGTLWHLPS